MSKKKKRSIQEVLKFIQSNYKESYEQIKKEGLEKPEIIYTFLMTETHFGSDRCSFLASNCCLDLDCLFYVVEVIEGIYPEIKITSTNTSASIILNDINIESKGKAEPRSRVSLLYNSIVTFLNKKVTKP